MELLATILIGLLLEGATIAVFVIHSRLREREFAKTTAAYERILNTVDRECFDLRDRLYGSKNLPPQNTNLQAEYQERKERQELHRVNGGAIERPHRIGPVDYGQLQMAEFVKQKREEVAAKKAATSKTA